MLPPRLLVCPICTHLPCCLLEATELDGVSSPGVIRRSRASKDVRLDHVELVGVPESGEGVEAMA